MKHGICLPDMNGEGLRIAIVQSRFNLNICEKLRDSCIQELIQLSLDNEDILLVTVPGALEIPMALQKLALSNQFDALIALGAVIRGETYHFEIVANESAAGVRMITNEYDIPIANGILTTDTEEQAAIRALQKGQDCARVAVEMANLSNLLTTLQIDEDDFNIQDE